MSDLDDAIERLNPDNSPKYLYRGPSNTADVEDDLRLVIAAARERDALSAVIEEARAIPHGLFGPWDDDVCDYEQLAAILSRTPSDVLAERDARIRAEVIDWIAGESDFSFEFVAAAREHFGLTKGADRD